jgi:hypothetical protein
VRYSASFGCFAREAELAADLDTAASRILTQRRELASHGSRGQPLDAALVAGCRRDQEIGHALERADLRDAVAVRP